MKLVSAATLPLIVLVTATPVVQAADPPRIAHEKYNCVPKEGNVRVAANVTSSSPVISARVYFHSAARKSGDYYLELRKGDAGNYWAFLPYPVTETKEVQYRIVVKNADGLEASTETFTVPTSSSCALTLRADEARYANNLVIGLTSDSQPVVPDGFKCKGIVSKITVAGELMPSEECRQEQVAAAGAAVFWGVPVTTWAVGGAALAASGAAIAVSTDCKCDCVSCPYPTAGAVTTARP